MKKISQHLGKIILAVAAVALIIGVVLTFATPVHNFMDGVMDKLYEVGNGPIWNVGGTTTNPDEGGSTPDDGNNSGTGSEDDSTDEVHVDEATGEILDSWEEIISSVNDGSYATKYAVGNYKPLDLGTEGVVNMQIAALDTDVLSYGTGKAPITFIAQNALATRHNMKGSFTNENGWLESTMRTYLQNDIWALIPAEVQSAIVAVDKTYYDYTTQSTLTSFDKLWIPSWREIGLGTDKEDSGVVYSELFKSQNDRIKTWNGSPSWWWLRSARTDNSTCFYNVINDGQCFPIQADAESGVLLSFCIGVPEEPVHVDKVTGEILDSWEEITASVNDGTYATKYAVGNYKSLDLGSEGVINMQIAALDTDTLSDGTGKAHITWIAKELLATKHNMNSTYSNAKGWAASEMRTYLSEDIYALIPEVVQNAIVSVDKTYYDKTTSSTLTCSDKLWIPSWREVGFGTDCEDDGAIYSELFTGEYRRIKTLNGSASIWWLRSADSDMGSMFKGVHAKGKTYLDGAPNAYGVLLGFCM